MAAWSELEVDLIIEDYFQMLRSEIRGIKYKKSEHRKKIVQQLNNRPEGAIERKHQNISAVLINNGFPYINGYKPLGNYQELLENKVLLYISKVSSLKKDFDTFVYQQIDTVPQIQYSSWLDVPPEDTIIKPAKRRKYIPIKKNYLELEQRNQSIGFAGEQLVFEYEKWLLINAGVPKLAKEVEWTSKERGDGAGYDILSRTVEGAKKFIEVKTTTLGKDAPIFYSNVENDFSVENRSEFYLYRVFNAKREPKMFFRNGSFADMLLKIEPVSFKGIF